MSRARHNRTIFAARNANSSLRGKTSAALLRISKTNPVLKDAPQFKLLGQRDRKGLGYIRDKRTYDHLARSAQNVFVTLFALCRRAGALPLALNRGKAGLLPNGTKVRLIGVFDAISKTDLNMEPK